MWTMIKVSVRLSATVAAFRTLVGYTIDDQQLEKGRLTRPQVRRIVNMLWEKFDALLADAELSQYTNMGGRQNALLSVLSLAAYWTLQEAGFSPGQATRAFADMGWQVYMMMIRLPRIFARLLYHSPQKQMNLVLRALLVYPFGQQGGYEGTAWLAEDGFHTDWTLCPPLEIVKAHGDAADLDFFFNTWCQYDHAVAQAMAPGGLFERPHCMSRGDAVCDMRWYVAGTEAGG